MLSSDKLENQKNISASNCMQISQAHATPVNACCIKHRDENVSSGKASQILV